MRLLVLLSITLLLGSLSSCNDKIVTPDTGGNFVGPPSTGLVYWAFGGDGSRVFVADTNGNNSVFSDSAELEFGVGHNTFLTKRRYISSPIVVHSADGSVVRAITADDGYLLDKAAVSFDGSMIAVNEMHSAPPDGYGKLELQSRDGATTSIIDDHSSSSSSLAFSTDGKYLIYERQDTNGTDLVQYAIENHSASVLAHSVFVNSLISVSPDGAISFGDIENRTISVLKSGSIQTYNDRLFYCWSPDGSRIASSTLYTLLLSTDNGTTWQTISSGSEMILYPSWSPDGSRLLYGKATGSPSSLTGSALYEYDLRTGRERKLVDNAVFGYLLH